MAWILEAIDKAPSDDRPYTDEERTADAKAREGVVHGGFISTTILRLQLRLPICGSWDNFQILWSQTAKRTLATIESPARVLDAVERLANEGAGDVKSLPDAKGVKRLLVGECRVRFEVYGQAAILVLHVDHLSAPTVPTPAAA